MRFEQLNALVAIGQYHSMNKASQSIYVSQQAISNAIIDLEKELGVQLVSRTNRGSFLTDAGARLVEAVNDFYLECEHIVNKYRGDQLPKKQIELYCEYSQLAFYEILSIYYMDHFPETTLIYGIANYKEILKNIDENPEAVGVLNLTDQQLQQVRKKYYYEICDSSHLVLCVSQQSFYAGYESISMASIHHTKILFYSTREAPSTVYYAILPYELDEQDNVFVFNTTMTIQQKMMKSTDAVMFIPESALARLQFPFVQIPIKEKIVIHQCLVSKSSDELKTMANVLRKKITGGY